MNCKMLLLPILFLLMVAILPAQDGDLDPSFGIDGKVISDVTGMQTSFDKASDVLLQTDGKILVAGTNNSGFLLVRYHPNGDIDEAFGNNGYLVLSINFSFSDGYAFLALQPDGKILLSGQSEEVLGDVNFFLARINSDGSLDTSFGDNGIQITDFLGDDDVGRAVKIQPDGKILQAGDSNDGMGVTDFALIRYLSDGSLDPDFGIDGKVVTRFPTPKDYASAFNLVIQDDLKIVLSGFIISNTFNNDSGRDYAIARYHPDGSLDQSFGEKGLVIIVTDDLLEFGTGLALQKDQKILLTGQTQLGMIRLNNDGSLDDTFGEGGKVLTPFGVESNGRDIVLQEDGKILVAGMKVKDHLSHFIFVVARYLSDGSQDPTFGKDGMVFTEFGESYNDISNSLVVQEDNNIIVAGYTPNNLGANFVLARYLSNLKTQTTETQFLTQETTLYPNPVSTHTLLEYSLTQTSTISIDLYETSGKWVQNILAPTQRVAGLQQESIQLVDGLASGNYFLVISDQEENFGIGLVKE